MAHGITAALIVAGVLGLWFPTTRTVAICAISTLAYLFPLLSAAILILSVVAFFLCSASANDPPPRKENIVNFSDCISNAIQHCFDLDIPQDLLPLTITQDACMLAGLESDRMCSAAWD